MVEVGGFFGLLLLILVVYAIVKTVQSRAGTLGKVIWVVLLLMLPVLGFILWLLFGVHVLTAVHRDRGAGDEAGLVRTKKSTARAMSSAWPRRPDRDAADDLLQHLWRHRANHLGVHVAGRDGVDRDALGRALLGQGLGEAVDAGLGGGVVDLAVLAGLAVDGADVDDAPEAALAHASMHRVSTVEAGAEVGVDDLVPLLVGHLVHGAVAGDAGVVDQDVDRPEVLLDLGDAGCDRVVVADVELVGRDAVRSVNSCAASSLPP
jgi:hypothetical protein